MVLATAICDHARQMRRWLGVWDVGVFVVGVLAVAATSVPGSTNAVLGVGAPIHLDDRLCSPAAPPGDSMESGPTSVAGPQPSLPPEEVEAPSTSGPSGAHESSPSTPLPTTTISPTPRSTAPAGGPYGQVVDPSGRPLAGICVTQATIDPVLGMVELQMITGPDGAFDFDELLPPGLGETPGMDVDDCSGSAIPHWYLVPGPYWYAPDYLDGGTIVMRRAAAVTGRVMTVDGRPVPNACARASEDTVPYMPIPPGFRGDRTRPDGTFGPVESQWPGTASPIIVDTCRPWLRLEVVSPQSVELIRGRIASLDIVVQNTFCVNPTACYDVVEYLTGSG